MYSWLITRCVVWEQIVVSVLWSCQVWDIVQQQLGAGSTVQWFSDRRSIYMSLSLYGYVYMSGCVCIVVFYCLMVLAKLKKKEGASPRFLCRPTAFCSTCWSRRTSESSTYGKQRICARYTCNRFHNTNSVTNMPSDGREISD
jgi:hypothetical protein